MALVLRLNGGLQVVTLPANEMMDKYLDEGGLAVRRGHEEKGEFARACAPSGHSHHYTGDPEGKLATSRRFPSLIPHIF